MLYELHLNAPPDALQTSEIFLEALASSGAAWESVESNDIGVLCLICTSPDVGLEVVLLEGVISLSIPATYTGQAARDAFDLIWRAVRGLQTLAPAALFDPQLDKTISPDNPFDVEKVLLAYAGLVRHQQSFEL